MTRRKLVPCLLCRVDTWDDDQICGRCRSDHKNGQALREQLKKHEGDLEPMYAAAYWYLYHFAGNQGRDEREVKSDLQRSLLQLAQVVPVEYAWESERGIPVVAEKPDRSAYERINAYLVPKGYASLLQQIYRDIVDLLAHTYEDGLRKGSSVLQGLASGRTSIDDFNRLTKGDLR